MFDKKLWTGKLCRTVAGGGIIIQFHTTGQRIQRVMNPIKNIEIKNFKSIRHQTIDDCKRINVFIGYPNVGKSNILEAIGLISINKANLKFSDSIRNENATSLFFNGDISNPFEVILGKRFRFKGEYKSNEIDCVFQWNPIEKDFSEMDKISFSMDWRNSGIERVELQRIISFSIKENSVQSFAQYPTPVERQKLEPINIPVFKKYNFNNKVSFSDETLDNLTQPFGQNIFSILSANSNLRADVSELFKPYDLKFSFDKSTRTFKILKSVGDDIFIISYSMIADTLQRLIFYKVAIASNKESVLLFEEPEAHMFPPYIKKFTTDVIFDKTNQFFITTHSPYVLDELILEAENELSVYLVDYKDGETKIHHLSSSDLKEVREYGVDLFFNIESYLKHGQVNNA